MNQPYEEYRRVKIETGLRYQDFVCDVFLQICGIPIVQYASQLYQMSVGESRQGFEIKHDEKFSKTGNLWIEVAEKARPRNGDYVSSGIYREDNSWLYIIGDYDIIFIHAQRILRAISECGRYEIRENDTRTSRGFLLNNGNSEKWALRILKPNARDKIAKSVKDLAELGRILHHVARMNPAQRSLFDISAGLS